MKLTSRFNYEAGHNELLTEDGKIIATCTDGMLTTYLESEVFDEQFESFAQTIQDDLDSIEQDEEEEDLEEDEDDGCDLDIEPDDVVVDEDEYVD